MNQSTDGLADADLVLLLPRLNRFANSLTGSKQQAEDLVQETLLRAFAAWRDLAQEPSSVAAWMFRIMRNVWLDIQKAQRVRRHYADMIWAGTPTETSGENTTLAALTLGAVDAALQLLPEEQRAVLLLICVEEFTYAQAAEALDIPVGTVMSRLARARSGLKRLMNGSASANDDCAKQARETIP
jgi:RNA polymerase sigma-70 factor (ECF subfamily)